MKKKIKFKKVNSNFSTALKDKINQYFNQHSIEKTGDIRIYSKTAILLFSFALIYVILVFVQPHWLLGLLLCTLFGINLAAIGFNIMHDAGHDSYSKYKGLNSVLSYSLNLLGGNIYFWKLKHNIAHHTYTNIEGEDHDIEVKFIRVHEDQELKKYHKYQHIYFIFLYSISYLAWIFFQDYEKYFKQRLGYNSNKFRFPIREKVIFWISKLIHLLIFIVIPIAFVGIVPALIGLLVTSIVCGILLATVFQLAHVVSETKFQSLGTEDLENEWMVHQLNSTANFSTTNKLTTWLLGGLNFQVEHHLFPKISHIHYPALNKIIKQTCKEFNINYIEFRTFTSALTSHIKVLKLLSRV